MLRKKSLKCLAAPTICVYSALAKIEFAKFIGSSICLYRVKFQILFIILEIVFNVEVYFLIKFQFKFLADIIFVKTVEGCWGTGDVENVLLVENKN